MAVDVESTEMDVSKDSEELNQLEHPVKNKPNEGKQRSKEGKRSRKEKAKLLTKVIIRRLPPSMTEEVFLKQINPLPDHDEFYFMPADGLFGEYTSCRAYINFVNQDDIFIFKDKFDGYVFVDTKGAEYPAIVEFAPFQGLAKNKSRKKDNKSGTIETDPHFMSFIESLNSEDTEVKTKTEYSFQLKDDKKITSTPLLEFIAGKKQEKKDERKKKKDEKRSKKKIQVAKSIPAAILEHEEDNVETAAAQANDDGIVVRTVKSRTGRDMKDRPSRKDREKDAKQPMKGAKSEDKVEKLGRGKRAKRRAARDALREENKLPKIRDPKKDNKNADEEPSAQKPVQESSDKPPVVEEKVKRYSESRRERRLRAENQRAENEKREKALQQNNPNGGSVNASEKKATAVETEKEVVQDKPKLQTQKSTDDSKREYSSGETEKSREDRLARRIKNKDRPSIQIYQPKPRGRLSSIKKDDSKSGDEHLKESCESNNEKSSKADDEPLKKDKSDVEPEEKTEKKVSRYSERRNRAKEQRESRLGSRSVSESSQTAAEARALDEVKSIESKTEIPQSDTVE